MCSVPGECIMVAFRNLKLRKTLEELDEGTREDFDERAGIMEFDGGLSRRDAERAAWQIVVLGKRLGG